MSNTTSQLFGNYQSKIVPGYVKTVYQGLCNQPSSVQLVLGCESNHCNDYDDSQREAVKAAVQSSDAVILNLGTGINS